MIRKEIPIIDGWYYIQGHFREGLYFSKFKFLRLLIRKHIREQIEKRIFSLDKECWRSGECKICGCAVPALAMCDKACHKPCYPPMMNKRNWRKFNKLECTYIDGKIWYINKTTNKFEYVESN